MKNHFSNRNFLDFVRMFMLGIIVRTFRYSKKCKQSQCQSNVQLSDFKITYGQVLTT